MRLSRFVRSSRSDGAATWEVTKLQSKISTTQLELFNESALPEAVTLHADRPGFFSLLVKPVATTPRQTSYRVDLLPQVLAALDPDIDSYMSQATFFRPNRRLVNLWHLPLCFVDLDTYKTAYGKLHEEPLSLAVRQHLTDEGIPPASLVVHSGRGVYLKWLLKSPLPQAALPRWNAVQRELVSRLADLGADPKARDASRVLRLVSTCNTKQPDPEFRKVRVLWVEEADGAPLLHDFEQLAEAVLPFTRDEAATIEAEKPEGRVIPFEGGEAEGQARRFSFETLHWDRVTDIRKLRQQRGTIAEGGRETFVFLMLNDLVAWIIPKDALSSCFSTLGITWMPHKFNAARRHKFDKAQYRVIHWAEYNESLRQRGDLTIWVSEEAQSVWSAPRRTSRGGQRRYSDLAIETCLTLRTAYRLGLRQTQGLMDSIGTLMGLDIRVPDFSTLSRRANGLSITQAVRQAGSVAVHLVVDSTGLKIFGEGEWLAQKHKIKGIRRRWRKLHLGLDLASGAIVCADLTDDDVGDSTALPGLLDQLDAPVTGFLADGAYDGASTRDLLRERYGETLDVVIPPPKNAVIRPQSARDPTVRDRHITQIRRNGRMAWQAATGYNRRSRIETQIGRWKSVIGPKLKSRGFSRQITEIQLGQKVLNTMTALGRPVFERIA